MSTLSYPDIVFLQRLIASGSETRRPFKTVSAAMYHSKYGIGYLKGKHFEYVAQDVENAKNLLLSHNFPITEAIQEDGPRDRAGASLMPGISEKSGSVHPHEGEVAVLALTKGCLLDGTEFQVLMPGYTVMHHSEAARIDADIFLVVENLETMKQIHRYRWIVKNEIDQESILVIFRGDTTFRGDHVLSVLRSRVGPVWSFPDFDPAGLGHASSIPQLQKIILPWDALEKMARTLRRVDLFEDQLGQWEQTLNACDHSDIKRAWKILKWVRAGINQEAMRDI